MYLHKGLLLHWLFLFFFSPMFEGDHIEYTLLINSCRKKLISFISMSFQDLESSTILECLQTAVTIKFNLK